MGAMPGIAIDEPTVTVPTSTGYIGGGAKRDEEAVLSHRQFAFLVEQRDYQVICPLRLNFLRLRDGCSYIRPKSRQQAPRRKADVSRFIGFSLLV